MCTGIKFGLVIGHKRMCRVVPLAVVEFKARVGIDYRVGGWSMCLGKRRIAATIVFEFFPVDVEYKFGRVEVETIGLGNHYAIFRSK